jgi:hypothetical protein
MRRSAITPTVSEKRRTLQPREAIDHHKGDHIAPKSKSCKTRDVIDR